ncbi:MAG: hypothetical protein SGARI_001089, partial [Bacillariaceae sp.]
MMSLLLVFVLLATCAAFAPTTRSKRNRDATELYNWLSGVTGVAPSALLPSTSQKLQETLTESTSLQDKQLACVYKASRDGWSAIDFHNAVDEKGSCLVMALARSGTLFGGFNPVGYRSTDDYYNSNAAFLFCVNGGDKVTKFPALTGGNAAIFDYATGGPCFGSSDLIIGEPRAAV